MREKSEDAVRRWWSTVLGVSASSLWRGTTVEAHAETSPLRAYGGWWVVRGGEGLHVSLPPGAEPPSSAVLAGGADDETWTQLARERGLRVVGPSRHAYLDVVDGAAPAGSGGPTVRHAEPDELATLRAVVAADDWEESGFGGLTPQVDVCFAVVEGDVVVAASILTPFDGRPRDVGVLVAPAHRGRGLGVAVGRHACAHAVREHGLARWRAQRSNVASLALADRLGFEPWCWQLALRRRALTRVWSVAVTLRRAGSRASRRVVSPRRRRSPRRGPG